MPYEVKLDVFEGPFDLLLQLIARRRVDIMQVDLAEITGDFVRSLGDIDELDLETSTHFLVVAATLVELKAVRLLPEDERDEATDLLDEARDLLYARLLEYRAFRDASLALADRLDTNRGFVGRDVPLEPRLRQLVPDVSLNVDVGRLAELAARALRPRRRETIDLTHVQPRVLPVRAAAHRIIQRLANVGARSTFRELTAGLDRPDRIAVFLALLELYKRGHVDLVQPEGFGALTVERRTDSVVFDELEDGADTATAQPPHEPALS